ncbi:hypothetical protein [Ruegeria denitrificans]|nr:hypothetical protein [Ruegeria denitrificans]
MTFDWFNYSDPLQRVHQAMWVHQQSWSTRALATHTNLSQTTVRRQLDLLAVGNAIERTERGIQLTELQLAFNVSFFREIRKYVRGGSLLDKELLNLFKQSQGVEKMNWQMLEHHVWWPIIDEPDAHLF